MKYLIALLKIRYSLKIRKLPEYFTIDLTIILMIYQGLIEWIQVSFKFTFYILNYYKIERTPLFAAL